MFNLIENYLSEQFDKLLSHESRALEGSDPEGVHQMRVATRSIRAAFRAFKNLFPVSTTKSFNRDFKWLAAALGDVRDLDVYRGNLRRYVQELPKEDADHLTAYYESLDDQWQQARKRLLECMNSQRYSQLKSNFAEFLKQVPSAAKLSPDDSRHIGVSARNALKEQYKHVIQKGRTIKPDSPDHLLHELRIECKRLRYLFDLFRPIYGKHLDRPVKQLKCLQCVLGEFQDAHLAEQNLREYADQLPMRSENRGQLIALGQLIQIQHRQGVNQRNALKNAWQTFDHKKRRKKLLARLAQTGSDFKTLK